MYQVIYKDKILYKHPIKFVCLIWCVLKGLCCYGGRCKWLIEEITIKEIK